MKPRLGDSDEDGMLALGVDRVAGSAAVALGARKRAQVIQPQPARVLVPAPAVVPVIVFDPGGGDGDGGSAGDGGDGSTGE